MSKVSPIIPMPAWFFSDLLVTESKDMARIISAFIKQSLDTNKKKITASYRDIEGWTGLVPDRVSVSIRALREKGFLLRIKAGKFNTKSGKRVKAVYAVNWDCKEKGTETKIRQIYSHINDTFDVVAAEATEAPEFNISGNIADIAKSDQQPKDGERVRVGRFGDEVNGRKWFTVGFDPLREKIAAGPIGVMMRKLAEGRFDELTARDFLSYWEHRYMQRHNVPYIPYMGRDLGIINKLRKVIDAKQILRIIRFLFDSGQRTYYKPNVGILGSRLINDINTKAVEWARHNRNGRK